MELTLEDLMKRERLRDELRGLQHVNIAQLPGESYEDNLKRRAAISLRESQILDELAW